MRLLVRGLFRGAVAPQNAGGETGFGAAVTAEADIVEHAQRMKQGRALKSPDQPKLGERAGLSPRDVLPEIDDLAAGRRVEAADDVEGRGLAGAVRTDQAMNRTRIDIEAEVVDGNDTAKGANQIANLENRLLGRRHRRDRSHADKNG
jgi:hypothetical protein